MSTDSTSTPRRTNDARLYKAIAETEHRLMDSFERGLKEVKEAILERKNETGDVRKELDMHAALDGHPLLAARVVILERTVERMTQQREQAPIKAWQVVTAALFVLFSFIGVILTLLTTLHIYLH